MLSLGLSEPSCNVLTPAKSQGKQEGNKMTERVLTQLPTLRDVELAISRNARDAALLRSLRDALRKRKKIEDVSQQLRERAERVVRESEGSHA